MGGQLPVQPPLGLVDLPMLLSARVASCHARPLCPVDSGETYLLICAPTLKYGALAVSELAELGVMPPFSVPLMKIA